MTEAERKLVEAATQYRIEFGPATLLMLPLDQQLEASFIERTFKAGAAYMASLRDEKLRVAVEALEVLERECLPKESWADQAVHGFVTDVLARIRGEHGE